MTDTPLDPELLADLQARHPGWTPHQILAVMTGKSTEAEVVDRRELDAAEARLRQTGQDQWPTPDLDWDLDPANFHRSMDTYTAEAFAEDFGDVGLYWIEVEGLVGALASTARRTGSPFDQAYLSKTRRLIAHLDRGGKVTPPLIHWDAGLDGLALAGGYHRTNWALHTKAGVIPVLIRAAHFEMVKLKVTLSVDASGVDGLRGYNQGWGKP